MQVGYYFYKLISKVTNNHQILVQYYRRRGVKIGKACLICSNPVTQEPFLISIGNHTTISTNVTLITHDYSCHLIIPESSSLFGKITIGDNCFVGAKSTIMYGVTLADNTVVGAGSVVTRSFLEPNKIIAGNPARVIGTWAGYREKYSEKAAPSISKMSFENLYRELKKGNYLIEK